ncbi:glycosyltransferase family 39 protein [Thalassoglobus sp. JC818]|uniref:ArnT family glycosyltransferase n=1 Tax=Thalassoglobus sp. JC818 TaxID=3232136 RepID=UPI00345A70B3
MNQSVRDAGIILFVAGVAFLTNLGGPHLWDRDEPRNAGCAAEMLAANDWVKPTFNAELREHKPVLTYWFMMISYAIFGVTEFSARLPSALLGIGSSLLTWLIGRRLFGARAGLWAGVAIATTLMFGVASRAATPDAPLIFFSTLAIAIYVVGTTSKTDSETVFEKDFPDSWPAILGMYAAMGMAVLAKGPIGLVLPTAVIGMFLLIRRLPEGSSDSPSTWSARIRKLAAPFAPVHFLKTCWTMKPITCLACVAAIALPWYLWVHFRTDGEWTYGFFVKHNVGRAMNSMDGHRGNILFYPATLIVGFFPWSIFWLITLLDGLKAIRQNNRYAAGYLFAICWVGVYVALFSLAKTKLPSYITPCYPGLAIATGAFIDRWNRGSFQIAPVWSRLAFGSVMFVGTAVLIGIPIASSLLVPGEMVLGLLGLIPLVGGLVALLASERQQIQRATFATAVTAVLMSPAVFAFAADRIDRHRRVDEMVDSLYQNGSPESVDVISFHSPESSWIFYAKQPIERFREPEEARDALFGKNSQGQSRVLMTTTDKLTQLRPYLRESEIEIDTMPFFLEGTDIAIVRPIAKPVQQAGAEASTIR